MLKKQEQSRQRGATLLFSVAILALLALFSVVFARLMNLERRASAYYTDRVRAKLAARAGIERAIVELQKIAGTKHYSNPWADGWGYQLTAPPQIGTRPLDLQSTTTPSFVEQDPDNRQRLGSRVTYSGNLGVPYRGSLLLYRLKILDAASQVNLNHRDGAAAQRMLRNLLRAELGLPTGRATAIAARVVPDTRVFPDRFRSKPQIGALLTDPKAPANARITEEEYLYQIRDKITVHSWEDPNTVQPWNLSGNAQHRLSLMPRAPININTASRAVLVALFAEASAQTRYGTFTVTFGMAERLANAIVARRRGPDSGAYSGTSGFRPFRSWKEFEGWVDGDDPTFPGTTDGCPASVFLAGGGGVGSNPTPWPENVKWYPRTGPGASGPTTGGFYRRMQTLHQVGHRDLVKAICNPNTMANKFGMMVNHGGWKGKLPRMVDKTDMVALTTEACFDSMGVFEITSAGMILLEDEENANVGYEILAAHTDQMVIQVYTPYRLTTQHDFEKHRAFMVPGNFVDSPEATTPQVYTNTNQAFAASVNLPAFFAGGQDYAGNSMPMPGWPGLVTWPQYSLDRLGTADHPPKAEYAMASWDGYMTLSNMITVRTGDPDFVTGFSRGKLEAFKARAWWEPRDRKPSGPPKLDTPTRPNGPAELAYLAKPLGGEPPGAPGGSTTSKTVRVRSAINTGEASIIAEDFSDTSGSGPPTNAVELWTRGSQLYNTGVLIAPDRVNDSNDALFLAYDSNNIDLVRGSSIRFWVQPLRDPYAQTKEVLFSFVGSNGAQPGNTAGTATTKAGILREAGFTVYKEVNGNQINIVLEAVGETNRGIDYQWASFNNGGGDRVTIPVTPKPMNGASEPEMNPKNPEWIPGTWHWVVINIGPGTIRGGRHSFATIQVDKSNVSAPIAYRGDDWGIANNPFEPGELNMYEDAGGTLIGVVSRYNDTSPNIKHLVHPRQLGDYYHCMQHKAESKVSAGGQNQGADHGVGTISVFKEREYATPADGGPAIIYPAGQPVHPWFPWTNGGGAGSYATTANFPVAPFPIISYNQRQYVRLYDASGARAVGRDGRQVPDLEMTHSSGTDQWTVPWPDFKSNVYGIDADPGPPGARGPVSGRDYNIPAGSPTGYPGGHEWHMGIYVTWEEAHYLASSEWGNTEPTWAKIGILNSWLPADLTKLYSIEEPFQPGETVPADYETNGETLPYSVHNSGRTTKGGQPGPLSADPATNPQDPNVNFKRSYIRTKVPLRKGGQINKLSNFPNPIPLDYLDDDCHGCEDCDLDGPIFIGGEPAGNNNYVGGNLAPVDKDSMAYAVFDNIVFLNNDPTRRTDVPNPSLATPDLFEAGSGGGTIPPVNLELKNFEDRFFEEDLAQYLVARGDPKGTGAIYHRGLLELRNTQVRLGSMTWTSYPTNSPTTDPNDSLNYEVALWKVPNIIDTTAGTQTYNYGNNVLAGRENNPDWGFLSDPTVGITFSAPGDPPTGFVNTAAYIDGLGDLTAVPPVDQNLMVIGIRLMEHNQNRKQVVDPTASTGVIKSPIVESPIFEDITLNLIIARPVIMYAEEGATE